MYFDHPFEFRTPKKLTITRTNHKHNSSQPTISKMYTEQQEIKTNLTNSGLQTLKQWDFFSDPFSLPEKYQSSPQIKLKSETNDSAYDSLDFIVGKQTDRSSSNSLQIMHKKTQSERYIGRKVQFADLVQIKKENGEESEEPVQLLSRKETRKSKFSSQNQKPPRKQS